MTGDADLYDGIDINNIINDVVNELEDATTKFGPFTTMHHGYAVILEELDELWEAIRIKDVPPEEIKAEAIQVAAMAIRFVMDFDRMRKS